MKKLIVCDWCKDQMKPIGIEYKPFVIYKCNSCHHEIPVANSILWKKFKENIK